MNKKVILVSIDGMGSSYLEQCSHPFIPRLLESGSANLYARTVSPSVTLPCHMSMFHSVTPGRHGIVTNVYVPQVRPVAGLIEQLRKYGKTAAFFYNWEELRDLSRPDSLACSCFLSLHQYEDTDRRLTSLAVNAMADLNPDFLFLYLGLTDEAGHRYGWGSPEYHEVLYRAWDCVQRIAGAAGEEYRLLVTSDHGGHEYTHGTEDPLDMQIPILLSGVHTAGEKLADASILDIAPTVAALLGVEADADWRGRSLL